jgi:hypothetical protein
MYTNDPLSQFSVIAAPWNNCRGSDGQKYSATAKLTYKVILMVSDEQPQPIVALIA